MPREGCLGAEAAAVENSREMARQRIGILPQGPRDCMAIQKSLDIRVCGDLGECYRVIGPHLNTLLHGGSTHRLFLSGSTTDRTPIKFVFMEPAGRLRVNLEGMGC